MSAVEDILRTLETPTSLRFSLISLKRHATPSGQLETMFVPSKR